MSYLPQIFLTCATKIDTGLKKLRFSHFSILYKRWLLAEKWCHLSLRHSIGCFIYSVTNFTIPLPPAQRNLLSLILNLCLRLKIWDSIWYQIGVSDGSIISWSGIHMYLQCLRSVRRFLHRGLEGIRFLDLGFESRKMVGANTDCFNWVTLLIVVYRILPQNNNKNKTN